jgi:hypothetical protein
VTELSPGGERSRLGETMRGEVLAVMFEKLRIQFPKAAAGLWLDVLDVHVSASDASDSSYQAMRVPRSMRDISEDDQCSTEEHAFLVGVVRELKEIIAGVDKGRLKPDCPDYYTRKWASAGAMMYFISECCAMLIKSDQSYGLPDATEAVIVEILDDPNYEWLSKHLTGIELMNLKARIEQQK